MSDEEEGFAKRWSRRKQEARLEEKSAVAGPEHISGGGELAIPDDGDAVETPETPVPDLPDIEDLDADSDFTPFMQAGVPESIQRLALRKLWQSNPALANLDGLNDYDDDFKSLLEAGAEYIAKAREAGEKFIGEIEDEPEDEVEETIADAEEDPTVEDTDEEIGSEET